MAVSMKFTILNFFAASEFFFSPLLKKVHHWRKWHITVQAANTYSLTHRAQVLIYTCNLTNKAKALIQSLTYKAKALIQSLTYKAKALILSLTYRA